MSARKAKNKRYIYPALNERNNWHLLQNLEIIEMAYPGSLIGIKIPRALNSAVTKIRLNNLNHDMRMGVDFMFMPNGGEDSFQRFTRFLRHRLQVIPDVAPISVALPGSIVFMRTYVHSIPVFNFIVHAIPPEEGIWDPPHRAGLEAWARVRDTYIYWFRYSHEALESARLYLPKTD